MCAVSTNANNALDRRIYNYGIMRPHRNVLISRRISDGLPMCTFDDDERARTDERTKQTQDSVNSALADYRIQRRELPFNVLNYRPKSNEFVY